MARKRALPLVFTHHTLYEQYTHYVPIDSDKLKNFVIRDGENGRLLPGDASTENFAEAIREFRSKPETAGDWRSGARQTAQRFSRKACAAKLENWAIRIEKVQWRF